MCSHYQSVHFSVRSTRMEMCTILTVSLLIVSCAIVVCDSVTEACDGLTVPSVILSL